MSSIGAMVELDELLKKEEKKIKLGKSYQCLQMFENLMKNAECVFEIHQYNLLDLALCRCFRQQHSRSIEKHIKFVI